ncbi:amino acid ABC transporter ATP-binding/permease protein [Gulosibacter hominis]|uniref:amino acid ABC transporter ATP-binding/permease protein n=1 Tax=Gulosibacter hominis TaxID=2770504 RepID=UPI001917A397|nr:ABC transporter ATP-binding protein [Gulosibacter hominis]
MTAKKHEGAWPQVRWLLQFAGAATRQLAGSIAARIIGQLLAVALLAVPAWKLGEIWVRGPELAAGEVLPVVVTVALLAIVKAVARYLEQLLGHLAAFSLMAEVRVWLLRRLVPQAPAITDGQGAARIQATAIRDVDRVEVFFAHTIAPAVTLVVVPLTVTIAAGVMSGTLPALAVAVVMLAGAGIPFMARTSGDDARRTAQLRADTAQHIADTLRLQEEVRAYAAADWRADQLASIDEQLAEQLRTGGRRTGIRNAATALRVWLGATLVALACIPALVADRANLPGVLVTVSFVFGTVGVFDTVERLATSLPAGLAATRRIRELASGKPTVVEPQVSVSAASASAEGAESCPRIELRDVHFSYPGRDAGALRGVSLQLPAGSSIALVGSTGSGKSTIGRLVQRHYDVDRGEVLIDGHPVAALGSDAVAARVAVADQQGFVVDGTVADNLRVADATASDEQLSWACEMAEFELPLDTPVGRRGSRISGGQRQRLVLARTLLRARNAPGGLQQAVLVLDEATSHQDPLTQQRMLERLDGLGITTLVIAHRLETLRNVNRIYVLERGTIVESGQYAELVAANGRFAQLLAATATLA